MLKKYLVILLCGSIISNAYAQDKAAENNKPQAYIRYGHLERWKEENTQITAFTGNVELYHAGKVIKADTLIAWNKGDVPETSNGEASPSVFNEVYAEGNIKVISEDDTILADRFYYNFANDTGLSINVEIRTSARIDNQRTEPLVLRAKMVYQIDKKTILAHQATVTSCTHGKPHYYFWASAIKFLDEEDGKRIVFYHIVPHFWGIPFFYIPYYSKSLDEDSLLRTVHYERTARFGATIQSKWGVNINKYKRDDDGNILKDKDGHYLIKRWGDLTLDDSYFQVRGNALEPELKYRWANYQGSISGYYINDKGPRPTAYDRGLYQLFNTPLPEDKTPRQRFKAFHRQSLNENIRADVEINSLSDRLLLIEFFEREAKEDKAPESYVYLRRVDNNTAQTLLGRMRLNEFQTQTEYLPRVNYYMLSQPVKNYPLYGSVNMEVSNIRQEYDELTLTPAQSHSRLDLSGELSVPQQMTFVRAMPFVSGRLTGYDKNLQENEYTERFIGSGGVRLSSEFSRLFEMGNKPIGINNLKHLISLDARYATNYQVTTGPNKLMATDQVDQIDEFGEWYFEIRNRFKTQNPSAQSDGNNYYEFLNIGLSLEKYPSARRDTTYFNNSSYFYPMNWIVLAPDASGAFPQRKTSNLNADVSFTPNLPFSIIGQSEYNTVINKAEVTTIGVSIIPYTGWVVSLTERYIMEKSNALALGLSCNPIEKWQLFISEQYDFKQESFTNRNYTLRRDFHEFFINFSAIVDKGKDETLFTVTFTPKGIFGK
jgi:lipopolysaccharide assembly outer membrane protein LptD (OstA)